MKEVENETSFNDDAWNKPTEKTPSPKITFMKGVPDWEWMIGVGTYLKDIKDITDANKALLKKISNLKQLKYLFYFWLFWLC